MDPPPKTILTIAAGVIIAIVPATCGYLQNRDELRAKYALTQAEASGGYEALSASVKELQRVTAQQHDFVVRLEAHLEAQDKFLAAALTRANNPTTSPAVKKQVTAIVAPFQKTNPAPEPPMRPAFNKLPDDIGDAAVMFSTK